MDGGLRVGGPATAANAWLPEFLDFCQRHHLPVDFLSTHHYPNDPLWSEAQDTEGELAGGQRGILREWTREARRQAGALPLLYTEWNASSNPRSTCVAPNDLATPSSATALPVAAVTRDAAATPCRAPAPQPSAAPASPRPR